MTRRAVALLATLLLTTAGCSGDDDATATTVDAPITNPTLPPSSTTSNSVSSVDPTTDSTTTSSTASTTTTPGQTDSTTTAPPPATTGPPPPTTPEGDPDWLAIVQGLSAVFDELQRRPDASRIDEFCAPGPNECRDVQGAAVQQFADEGWHAVDYPSTTLVEVELVATAQDLPVDQSPFVIVGVTTGDVDFTDARVVDGDGEVVFDIVSDGLGGRANWILNRDAESRWRVAAIVRS